MPIYVYRNLATGETFEVEQRMVDAALTHDPVTGDPVKRLIQPVGIAFKGSGFYVNDSRGAKSSTTSAGAASANTSASKPGDAASAPSSPPPAPAASSAPASGAAAD